MVRIKERLHCDRQAFMEALQEEQQIAKETYCAPEPQPVVEFIDFDDTATGVRETDSSFNWMLASMVK